MLERAERIPAIIITARFPLGTRGSRESLVRCFKSDAKSHLVKEIADRNFDGELVLVLLRAI